MKTTQFNMRISKSLLWDLDYIAEHRKVNRNDWLRYKIAELISEEVTSIKEATHREYLAARISEEEFIKKMGFKPPKELRDIRDEAKGYQRKYIQSILKQLEKENKHRKKTSLTEENLKVLDKLSEKEYSGIWDEIKEAKHEKKKKKRKKKHQE